MALEDPTLEHPLTPLPATLNLEHSASPFGAPLGRAAVQRQGQVGPLQPQRPNLANVKPGALSDLYSLQALINH